MKITKEEFLQHMECGLKRAKWARRLWWRLKSEIYGWDYNQTECTEEDLLQIGEACAIGAAALSQKMTPKKYVMKYLDPQGDVITSAEIAEANDTAICMEQAIKNISELSIWDAAK